MKAFIICRDRVSYARRCLDRLRFAGFDVFIVDHASTWPPAVKWLDGLERWNVPVLRREENAYAWKLWEWEPFREVMWGDDRPYLVTDPDVIPSERCPDDWPEKLAGLLDRHGCVKAGLGLRLDRLPGHRRDEVLDWERGFWEDEAEPGAFRANIDTTLALYKPWTEYPLFSLGPSLRTGHPYVADHLAWYEDPEKLSPELTYYHAHADSGHGAARVMRW